MRRPGPSRARSSRRLSGDERAELLRLRAENAEFRMELCSNDPWSWGYPANQRLVRLAARITSVNRSQSRHLS